MATVLAFPELKRGRSAASEQLATPAQILFFTGVRYERFEAKELLSLRRPSTSEPTLPLAL